MNMKVNDVLHGFRIDRIRKSEELNGTLYEMRHERTGAVLAYLDNGLDNKLFSVTFKTLPWDDTGVFHILEHSVLAGSDNYPVKEPFLDLLKSSMNTFLNAMTFPDKTMYPVSSRNEQDFLNLTRVYLDAVFRPAIYHNESIFRQEGWHYEPAAEAGAESPCAAAMAAAPGETAAASENADGSAEAAAAAGDAQTAAAPEEPAWIYNGVVYNEMKGALSSVDGLLERLGKKTLFPDTTYGFESGGDPAAIPDLSYERFLEAHRTFYSPANARFYLDGSVPLDKVLRIIDEEYLGQLDFVAQETHPVGVQAPIPAARLAVNYEIGADEAAAEKTQILYGKVFASWEERKRIMAYSLMASYLAGNNESPLTRAILEAGLAQNVEFVVMDGIAQPFYMIIFKNTDPEKEGEIRAVYEKTLAGLLADGIDKEALTADLNQLEFFLRETEEPSGLLRAIRAMSSWLYDGDPMLYLENNEVTAELREALAGDYYDSILEELLDPAHMLTMVMEPSATKGEEDRAAERTRLAKETGAMNAEEKQQTLAIYEAMRTWQDTEDTPEAKATLPQLTLADVSPVPMWTETEVTETEGVTVLRHNLATNGIVHCNLYFNIADERPEDLSALSMAANLFSVLPTKKHDAAALQKEIKKIIGILDFSVDGIADRTDETQSRLYFTVHCSALAGNLDAAAELVREILLETAFNNKQLIRENMLQEKESLYQSIIESGNAFASHRVLSHASASAYIREQTDGYALYRWLEDFLDHFDEKIDGFIAYCKARAQEIFTRERLLIGETAEQHQPATDRLATAFPGGEKPVSGGVEACSGGEGAIPGGEKVPDKLAIPRQEPAREAILIPAGVSYAAKGGNIFPAGHRYDISMAVCSQILTFGYLWNEIRVHGGAYGCGFRAGMNGNLVFSSYRDPQPLRSLGIFADTGAFLQTFCESGESIDKYIISTIAGSEQLVSTARAGYEAEIVWLTGDTFEEKQKRRARCLSLTAEDLLTLRPVFADLEKSASTCVVGSAAACAKLPEDFTVYRL